MFSLGIDSFRGFDCQKFNFAKYNILIGENSGGKTSLLKLLMLLKQSMRNLYSYDSQLLLDGPFVDLGGFVDFVKNHNINDVVKITYTTSNSFVNTYFSVLYPSLNESEYFKLLTEKCKTHKFLGEPVNLSFSFSQESITDVYKWTINFSCEKIGSASLNLVKNRQESVNGWNGVITFKDLKGKEINLQITASINGFMLFVDGVSLRESIRKQKIREKFLFDKLAYLLIAQNDFALKLDSFSCLNPVEYHPERFMMKRDMHKHNSVTDYQAAMMGLRQVFEREKVKKEFLNMVKQMGLAEDVEIDETSTSPVVSLKTTIGGLKSNVVDVGYGVSLQIPMLMHLIYMKYNNPDANIIFEQPEIHLHPALQAKFIEVLCKFGGKKNSFFIETHSEHMLRKLQTLVKKGIIKKEEVSVYYFKNEKGAFKVTPHTIDENGFVEPEFPKEFYDTDFELALELMK